MGGIASGADAKDFASVGASAVALGTVLFSDPASPARVRRELGGEPEAVEDGGAAAGTQDRPRRAGSVV
jgi:dihydroorotate dehydrogenase (NAD+) catalytic subunit